MCTQHALVYKFTTWIYGFGMVLALNWCDQSQTVDLRGLAAKVLKTSLCEAIVQLHCTGKTNQEIVKLLKAPKSTVWDAVIRYKELGTTGDQPRVGRPCMASIPAKIKCIRERIRRNPKQSMRKMAKSLKIDKKSVRTIVKKDLKMYPPKWPTNSSSWTCRNRRG